MYSHAALSACSCSNSRSMAPKRSHRRDLAGSGRVVVATPELGEGQLPPDPTLLARVDPAPFFESFFFFNDIAFPQISACGYL